MKNKLIIALFLFTSVCVSEEPLSFVTKKSSSEKPNQVKQEIAEIFESMLTQCCDMIVSVAQQQRLIVQHLKNLAQAVGPLAEKNLQDLKKCRDELKQMEEDCKRRKIAVEQQIVRFEKFL